MVEAADIIQRHTNMSKAVRWRVPFLSINGTQYRVDIYDEQDGSWSGITQLQPGDNPFTTQEDASDDFFCPVRTQTGTLQIITQLPSGDMISLDELLPANNIERPVKVWQLLGGGAAAILEWQGFLSCEAYNQDYTGIPQILDLPLIGVLEAMSSVFIDTSRVTDLKQARLHIYNAITEIDRQVGLSSAFFQTIYYSVASAEIWTKYLDATILYDIKEYNNEESYTYVVSGMSVKDVLSRLCTFMGWVCREQGSKIFFQRINEEGNMYLQTMTNFGGSDANFLNRTSTQYTTANLISQEWMGTGHQRSVMQGAKSVEVVASLSKYELSMGLPEFPTESLQHSDEDVIEAYVTLENDFNNMLTFNYYTMRSDGSHLSAIGTSDAQDAFDDCLLSADCDVAEQYKRMVNGVAYNLDKNVGAFFGMFNFSTEEETKWINALYIVAINELNATGEHAPTVFKLDSIINYRIINGTLHFKASGNTIGADGTSLVPFMRKVYMRLKFGTKYWNGSAWQTTPTYFVADFSSVPEEGDPGDYVLDIPVESELSGAVSIEVCGSIQGGQQYTSYFQPFYDLMLTELSLEYEEPEYITESDRSENKYYRVLGTNFRDEISVSAQLATTLNNRPSPSLIMQIEDGNSTPMRTMAYTNADGTTIQRRPEVDLLNRLAAYYGATRQRLELEVAHPTAAPLPLLKLNGINDGKVYLPLSESRDWQTDVCKLTCFEMPQ